MKSKGEQMSKKHTRETNIPITDVTSVAIQDGPSFRNPLPNCKAMNELGITFLNTDNPEEREAIEKIFAGVLQDPNIDDCRKFVALAFLRRTNAIVTNNSKDIVAEFEEDPVNANVVTAVKERLAYF